MEGAEQELLLARASCLVKLPPGVKLDQAKEEYKAEEVPVEDEEQRDEEEAVEDPFGHGGGLDEEEDPFGHGGGLDEA